MKPNIIFIFADQLRYDALGCNGNPIVKTPNIDSLANNGISFDSCYSTCPLCSPYRGAMLTGNYPHTNGVVDNEYGIFPNQKTAPSYFSQAGYKTAFIGKWHLGYGPYPKNKRFGFDDMYAYNNEHNYYHVSYFHNEEGPFKVDGYAPIKETELVNNYITDNANQPFYLCVGFGPPHWKFPYDDDPDDRDYHCHPDQYNIYDPDDIPIPPNVPKALRTYEQQETADYYAMTTSLDDCIGSITETLHKQDLLDNTIICITSDHGDHLGAYGYGKPGDKWMHHSMRASKLTCHEESIHVPFVLHYPRALHRGSDANPMFSTVDILPSLLDMAGIPFTRDGIQGDSILTDPAFSESDGDSVELSFRPGDEDDSVFLQILGPGYPPREKLVGLWRGVKTARYTYARFFDNNGLVVLYDRKREPWEMENLASKPEYSLVRENLDNKLREWIRKTDDPFFSGRRFPVTEMLDLGQYLTSDFMYENAPKEYRKAIEKYRQPEYL